MRTIAAIGNVKKQSTFSGTPYHFFKTSLKEGLVQDGWALPMKRHFFYRFMYNIRKVLTFQRPGGYQYSSLFCKVAYKSVPQYFWSSEVISFNQHFPTALFIHNKGGKIYYYIDATFTQLIERYGFKEKFSNHTIKKILKVEKENFENADLIVTFQNWCRDSVINDYSIDSNKVKVILPGANIDLQDDYEIKKEFKEIVDKDCPFVLGFIGKDWQRKGLLTLVDIKNELIKRGYNVKIKCAGYAPDALKNDKDIEFVGFINKVKNLKVFCDFVQSCDIGCLFSKAEFSSIAVLEFLRLGIPVAGFVVDGMGDLFFPQVSLRFNPNDKIENIADVFELYIKDISKYNELKQNAIDISSYVTWQRCVKEWERILDTR